MAPAAQATRRRRIPGDFACRRPDDPDTPARVICPRGAPSPSPASHPPLDHHFLDVDDRLGRVEALGAGLGAVHDRVAAVEAERVLEIVEPLALGLVARVDEPTISLEQDRRTQIAVAVPPVARAGGRAGGAENALIEAVELRPLLWRLQPFLLRRR